MLYKVKDTTLFQEAHTESTKVLHSVRWKVEACMAKLSLDECHDLYAVTAPHCAAG